MDSIVRMARFLQEMSIREMLEYLVNFSIFHVPSFPPYLMLRNYFHPYSSVRWVLR